ncbi:MAG: hydantoinase/oxoprolinase family protein [Alphaproteobacteria bacterium]
MSKSRVSSGQSRLTFDIGGTFTDFVLEHGSSGERHFWKVLSTPKDLSVAVMEGVGHLLEQAALPPQDVNSILHATTIATNAILERKGAKTALVTTKGFRDIILIGRQKRYDTDDLRLVRPVPLVRRRDIFELDERMTYAGEVLRAPSPESITEVVSAIRAGGYEAVAISLLHAYANPTHEEMLAEALGKLDTPPSVSLSSGVSPKFREYERTSTTVANAYIQPIVTRYVTRLAETLGERNLQPTLMIMQSNGGLVSPNLACETPIKIVESGPAAGVLMCKAVGQQENIDNLLTFDMGGTTAKLGAIDNGEPATLPTFEVDQIRYTKGSGLPLNISAIEMLEIGAGGGSIAQLSLGTIVVGPASAGSEPGPVCYGRGGTLPTVTDANAVLGYLNPAYFNGGRMGLDVESAAASIDRVIGAPTGLSLAEAAWSIHRMATANMERALRIMSVERGRDPRHYTLVGFGGAGPLHAARLARQVGVPKVIIPFGAGLGSAIGLLQATPKVDHSITRLTQLAPGIGAVVRRTVQELGSWAHAAIARMGGCDANAATLKFGATARYVGQGHEVPVDLPEFGGDEEGFLAEFSVRFGRAYKALYGFEDQGRPLEIIDWSITASVPVPNRDKANAASLSRATRRSTPGKRSAYFPELGGYVDCAIYDRYSLGGEDEISGPAIIEEPESTIVLLPGDVARISAEGNLVIKIGLKELS